MTQLLPLPESEVDRLRALWPAMEAEGTLRSVWLSGFERVLRSYFPQSSSRERRLTARHFAPFWLRDGHDVP